MSRYLALVWNGADDSTMEASRLRAHLTEMCGDWVSVLHTNGLSVYEQLDQGNSSCLKLAANGGVIIGRLFPRDPTATEPRDGGVSSDCLARLGGKHARTQYLLDECWGHYVAILYNSRLRSTRVLRDPSGALPCLWAERHGVTIFCSDVLDCELLGFADDGINWVHVAGYLGNDLFSAPDTGLTGINQLRPGECIDIANGKVERRCCWDPVEVSTRQTLDDRPAAVQELRSRLRSCIGVWAAQYSRILHRLSGGLDSSIVLACLAESDVDSLVCANHYTGGPAGDERTFARQAATRAKVELVEIFIDGRNASLAAMLDTKPVASPAHTNLLSQSHAAIEELVRTRGIQAVFSGQGGDHLFQAIRTPLIPAEYAWHHQFGPDLLRIVVDTSRFTRIPVASVLLTTLKYGLLRASCDKQLRRVDLPPLLSQEALAALEAGCTTHPWMEHASTLPGGKAVQILGLIDTQYFYCAPRRYASIVHPLLSQPIVELCLQIPSYVLTYGGIDRALVRDAFAHLVPSEIVQRTTKGATTGYFNNLLVNELSFARTLLLDGHLVGEGLLDRQRCESALTEGSIVGRPEMLWPMLNAIRAEAWVRSWVESAHRAAA